jgi:hypothetical protein
MCDFKFVLSMGTLQGSCLFEYGRALVARRVSGAEVLTDDLVWDPGFWLHDGAMTHKCRSRVQVVCDVCQHSRGGWNGL